MLRFNSEDILGNNTNLNNSQSIPNLAWNMQLNTLPISLLYKHLISGSVVPETEPPHLLHITLYKTVMCMTMFFNVFMHMFYLYSLRVYGIAFNLYQLVML